MVGKWYKEKVEVREKLFGVDVFAIRKPTVGKVIWNEIVQDFCMPAWDVWALFFKKLGTMRVYSLYK